MSLRELLLQGFETLDRGAQSPHQVLHAIQVFGAQAWQCVGEVCKRAEALIESFIDGELSQTRMELSQRRQDGL